MGLGAKERANVSLTASLYLFARLTRCRHGHFFLIEFVISMIGCSRYSNRAEMGASHGREIFPRKI